MKRRCLSLSAGLLLFLNLPAAGETIEYQIDPVHSLVGFNIRHFFTRVPGRFNDFEGTIRFDQQDMAKSTVEVTVRTASIDTENERRDNHLRSKDFFLVDSFPTMTFKSTKVVPGPDHSARVYGDLTLRGITKSVTLEASYLGSMTDKQAGRRIAGFEGRTTLDRKDFGILWNRVLDQGAMLGDDVAVQLQIEAFWRDPDAPPPPQRAQSAQQPEKR